MKNQYCFANQQQINIFYYQDLDYRQDSLFRSTGNSSSTGAASRTTFNNKCVDYSTINAFQRLSLNTESDGNDYDFDDGRGDACNIETRLQEK